MNTCKKQQNVTAGLWLAVALLLMRVYGAAAAEEQTFALLQIGTQTYTNVTVTTKAKDYIFILYAGGMTSLKVANLPAEVREKLGYASPAKTNSALKVSSAWAKAGVTQLDSPRIQAIRQDLSRRLHLDKAAGPELWALFRNGTVLGILALLVVIYLLRSYCFMLICHKAGHPPGGLVWLPVLQFFPLVRAAGMSGGWFVASLLPLLNLVTFVLWSVKIAKARGKSGWVTLFLILPPTYFLAVLYLAFSSGGAAEEDGKEPEVMTLQTA